MARKRITRLDPPLAVIFAGYRVLAAIWFTILVVIALSKEDPNPWVVWSSLAVVWIWSLITVRVAGGRPELFLEWPWLIADLAVGSYALLAPLIDGTTDPVNYAGGFPIASVILWAYVRGNLGAIVSGATMILIVTLPSSPEHPADAKVTVSLIYLIGAAVVAWGGSVLKRGDRARRTAERALADERAERLRLDERAELAARIHDSVLQTLALIQRRAEQPDEVRALARRQERSLRDWLFSDPPDDDATFSSAIRRAATEIEDSYDIRVDVVTTGDVALTAEASAVVAACREAMTNAAKFAGVAEISVFTEAGAGLVRAYVRDRGRGFDLNLIDPSRHHGITESILKRMERHGGSAEIRTQPGEGTEVVVGVGTPA